MDSERLRAHLRELHEELRQVERVDARSSALLGEVREDIRRLLAQAPEPGDGSPALAGSGEVPGRLERLAVGFEADHPTLAQSLRRLIDILSKAGV